MRNNAHKILIVALLLLNFPFVNVPDAFAVGTASLSLSPSSQTVNNGEEFWVEIRVNTGGELIGGVQAYLSYPDDKLDVLSLDPTGSALTGGQLEASFGGGSIKWSRMIIFDPATPVSGDNLLFGKIKFKAHVGDGSGTVSFVSGSSVIMFSETQPNILGPTSPGTYTFSSPTNPPTVDLRANGTAGSITVNSGTNAMLSWTSANATSCTASGDWGGSKPTAGSEQTGALTSNKSYTLRCDGAGSDTKTVQVNVANSPPRPTVSISAKPSSIKSGETSTLSWTSSNATSVGITPGNWTVGASGSKQVKPTASISYTAIAYGPGGSSNPASTSITVDNKPPPPPPPPLTDTTACKITDVKVTGVSLKSATIEWTTDEPTKGVLEYGLLAKYNFRVESTDLKKDHKVSIPSNLLVEATTYHYQIKCTDAAGNSGTIKDATFKTRGYTVKIKVTDQETGKAVASAKVTLSSEAVTTKTDKEGIATFEDVFPGEHLVTAEAGGPPSDLKIKVKEATDQEIATGKVKPQSFEVKVIVQKVAWQKYLPLTFGGGLLLVMVVFGLVWWKFRKVSGKKGDGEPEENEPPKPKPEVKQEAKQEVQGEGAEEFYRSLGPKPEHPPEPKSPPSKPESPPKMEVFRS